MIQHCMCYDHGPGLPRTIFFYYLIYLPFTYHLTTPFHPVSPTSPDPYKSTLTSIVHLCASFHIHRFIQLTYLMPCFTYYCMYHTTPDLVPIRLVVDRPLWTSPVYIRRPPP